MKNEYFSSSIELSENKKKLARAIFRAYCRNSHKIVRRFGLTPEEVKPQVDYFISTLPEDCSFQLAYKEFNRFFKEGFIGDDRLSSSKWIVSTDMDDDDEERRFLEEVESREEGNSLTIVELLEDSEVDPPLPSLLVRLNINWAGFFNLFKFSTFNYNNVVAFTGASKKEMTELFGVLNGSFADCLRKAFKEKVEGIKYKFYLGQQSSSKIDNKERTIQAIKTRLVTNNRGSKTGKKYPTSIRSLVIQLRPKNIERSIFIENTILYGIERGIFKYQKTKRGEDGIILND